VRCSKCGNENADGNRFCGMCGATLLTAEVPASQSQRAAMGSATSSAAVSTPARPRTAEPTRSPAPESEPIPAISGPSFLGLSDPAPPKRTSLSADSRSASRNLDYLLEDDEPRGGGAWKAVLILIALALAVGFGYLRWKNHGMDWLKSVTSKPPAATQDSSANEPAPSPAPSSSNESQAAPTTQPSAGNTASGSQPAAGTTASPAISAPASNDGSNPAPSSKPPDAAATAPKSDGAAASPATAPDEETTASKTDTDSAPAKQPSDSAVEDNSDQPDNSSEQPATKPSAAPKPPRTDPVAEAQKYLYGRGAAQDCDHGMRLLKPAANQGNSKAMVEMGALYSAGLCTPHDLPTAYRWFALALRKDPSNQAVQTDLQKLWGEMTQPERQLAIKLTQ